MGEPAEHLPKDRVDIALVVNNPILEAGLRAVFDRRSELNVLGAGSTGPDRGCGGVVTVVTAMDLSELFGREDGAWSRTVLLGVSGQENLLANAVRAGIRCLVLVDAPIDELVRAVHAAHAGSAFVQQALLRTVLDRLVSLSTSNAPMTRTLTDRERQVFSAIGCGLSNGEIAQLLTVSVRTVKFHVSNILVKLQMESRGQLIATAARIGHGCSAGPGRSDSEKPRPAYGVKPP